MDLEKIKSLGTEPCPGDAPCGSDCRYEPEYESLFAEIEKLTSITNAGSCNWQTVVENGTILLATKTKDIQVACYLAVALAMTEGVAGIAAGCAMLAGLAKNFWQDCFPAVKRMRARVNAFDWWREKTTARVQALDTAGQDKPYPASLVNGLADSLRDLDQTLGEVMPDFTPLRELIQLASRLPTLADPEPPAPAPPADESAQAAPAPGQADGQPASPAQPVAAPQSAASPVVAQTRPAPIPAPAVTDNMDENRKALLDFARSYAQASHQADLAETAAWQAMRLAVWGKILALPPAEGGTTMIPAPEEEQRAALNSLVNAGKMAEAALMAENLFSVYPFWLDLQFAAATALAALGPKYAPALAVVNGETRIFLQRLPDIEAMRFADGSPFADSKTLDWLASLNRTAGLDAEQPGQTGQGGMQRQHPAVAEANRLNGEGRLKEALDLLDKALAGVSCGAGRLPLRLAQVRLLIQAGQWLAAAGLAEEISETCTSASLVSFAPEQAAEALVLVRQVWEGLGGENGLARAWETGRILARIRPSAVLRTE